MISEENFNRTTILNLVGQAIEINKFLRNLIDTRHVDVSGLLDLLHRNSAMMSYAASEVDRLSRARTHLSEIEGNAICSAKRTVVH